jgi:hypothetical protein
MNVTFKEKGASISISMTKTDNGLDRISHWIQKYTTLV